MKRTTKATKARTALADMKPAEKNAEIERLMKKPGAYRTIIKNIARITREKAREHQLTIGEYVAREMIPGLEANPDTVTMILDAYALLAAQDSAAILALYDGPTEPGTDGGR